MLSSSDFHQTIESASPGGVGVKNIMKLKIYRDEGKP